jgi:hypothetical protein
MQSQITKLEKHVTTDTGHFYIPSVASYKYRVTGSFEKTRQNSSVMSPINLQGTKLLTLSAGSQVRFLFKLFEATNYKSQGDSQRHSHF